MKARDIAAGIGYAIGSAVRGFQIGASQRWEGWEESRERNRPPRALESVDWGVNYGVREGMLSEARNLEQTYALACSIPRKFADYCVSSASMKWNTGDIAIDKIYRDAWKRWMPIADVQGRHVFKKMTKIAIERVVVDGRVFGQLDRRDDFLQVAGIEGDRVSSNGIFNADTKGLVSGIGIDDAGRYQFYRVWERSLYGTFIKYQDIPANQIVHVFDADRFDSVSGVTRFNAVLNTLRDLVETKKAEGLSAKLNSKLALLYKSNLGAQPIVNLLPNDRDNPGDSTKINVQPVGNMAIAYMFPNEDIHAHQSDRPSEGWRWLMEWFVRETALAFNLPFGVVWHMAGLGGPAVRYEINQANRTFMSFLHDVIDPMWYRPIVGAWQALEMSSGRLPFHPNWYNFQTPRPKAITIDLGRDSKSGIAENAAGLGTATDWFAEDDRDFEEMTAQLVYEAKVRESLRLGIPIEQVGEIPLEQIRALGNVNTRVDSAPDDDGGNDDEPQDNQSKSNERQKSVIAR